MNAQRSAYVSFPECSNTPNPRLDLFLRSAVRFNIRRQASEVVAGPILSQHSLEFHMLCRGKAQYASLVEGYVKSELDGRFNGCTKQSWYLTPWEIIS